MGYPGTARDHLRDIWGTFRSPNSCEHHWRSPVLFGSLRSQSKIHIPAALRSVIPSMAWGFQPLLPSTSPLTISCLNTNCFECQLVLSKWPQPWLLGLAHLPYGLIYHAFGEPAPTNTNRFNSLSTSCFMIARIGYILP